MEDFFTSLILYIVYFISYNWFFLITFAVSLILVRSHKKGRWCFNIGVLANSLAVFGVVYSIKNREESFTIDTFIKIFSVIFFLILGHFVLRKFEINYLKTDEKKDTELIDE